MEEIQIILGELKKQESGAEGISSVEGGGSDGIPEKDSSGSLATVAKL